MNLHSLFVSHFLKNFLCLSVYTAFLDGASQGNEQVRSFPGTLLHILMVKFVFKQYCLQKDVEWKLVK
eukprot:UN19669